MGLAFVLLCASCSCEHGLFSGPNEEKPPAPPEPQPDRCSSCGSTDIVIWERFFGWMKYACNTCGHKATE